MAIISDFKAPLGVWGAIPDLKYYLKEKNISIRL